MEVNIIQKKRKAYDSIPHHFSFSQAYGSFAQAKISPLTEFYNFLLRHATPSYMLSDPLVFYLMSLQRAPGKK